MSCLAPTVDSRKSRAKGCCVAKDKYQLDVNAILRELGYGYLFADPFRGDYTRDPKNTYRTAWDCYDKMLAWDAEIAALDKVARLAVMAHEEEIVPAGDHPEDEKAAEFCDEMLKALPNWEDIQYDMLESESKGLSIIQKGIVRDGDKITVADDDDGPGLQTLPQHWFYWKLVENEPALVFAGMYNGKPDVALDPQNFIISTRGATIENPYGRGYLNEQYWTFVRKKIVAGFMIQLIQRGVEVERWVEVTENDHGLAAFDGKDVLIDALEEFQRRSEMVMPPGTTLKHQAGDAQALASEINVMHLFDNYLAKIALGQTLTTDQGRTGSYELGKIHDLQQARLTIGRTKKLVKNINAQLITPICEENFMHGRALWVKHYEPDADLDAEAERICKLADKYDLELVKKWAHETFKIPRPIRGKDDPEPAEGEPEEVYKPYRRGESGAGGGPDDDLEGFAGVGIVKKKITALASYAALVDEAGSRQHLIARQAARHLHKSKPVVEKRLAVWEKIINKSRSYEELAERVALRDRPWPEFADVLREATVTSYALGFVSQASDLTVQAAAPPGFDAWGDVMKAFKAKVPVDAETFYALDLELRPKYFGSAIALDEKMATTLHELTGAAMAEAQTFSVFKTAAYDQMRAAGYGFPEPYKLETIFRRHLSTADAAARDEWFEQPEVDEMIWGFVYMTSERPNVRPSHARLHLTKLPKTHSFWQSGRGCPPIDYG